MDCIVYLGMFLSFLQIQNSIVVLKQMTEEKLQKNLIKLFKYNFCLFGFKKKLFNFFFLYS
jgi:hypothetical protein